MGSTSQHRFPLEQFCSHRTKSPLARKSFVLAGQNLFFRKKSFVLPDKIFSGQKSLICFGRDFFWSNKILFGRKKAEIGSTKSFFFRTRFVWHGRDFFWLEEPVCHRKNSVWNKRSSFSTNKISFLKNEVCLYETSLVSTNEVSFVSDGVFSVQARFRESISGRRSAG